jgi:hypothetical protein
VKEMEPIKDQQRDVCSEVDALELQASRTMVFVVAALVVRRKRNGSSEVICHREIT